VNARILIIGDDPVLLRTRAEMLRDWQITAVSSREAAQALLTRNYDLLIFSQTVREPLARRLIAQARDLDPNTRVLAIYTEEDRKLGSSAYEVDLHNPGGLRLAVERMLAWRSDARKPT
jgi:DNA-binding NtrC family response regulator